MINYKNLISGIMTFSILVGTIITPIYAKSQAETDAVMAALQQVKADELNCLALNIYYEARGSNLADKAAVADVVINRTLDRRYPSSICDVVQDGYIPGKRVCQFSWYCDGKSDVPRDKVKFEEAMTNAKWVMNNYGSERDITGGAVMYHASYVNPYWSKAYTKTSRIESHIFYK